MSDIDPFLQVADALQRQVGHGVRSRLLLELADPERPYAVTLTVRSRAADPFARLTKREREVAMLVAAGYGNKAIAEHLVLSVGTVKDHVHSILRKSGLQTRAAVAAAWR